MKKNTLALTLGTLITLSSSAHALELLVVKNYNDSGNLALWQKTKADRVPESLLGLETTHAPGSSYSNLFPKTFFQESLFSVCHNDCAKRDIFGVNNGEIDESDRKDWEVIEQSNVYYWLSKYFNFLDEKLYFKPEAYLKVFTNRSVKDETKGKKMKNNAFFNPLDITLSFLPASKSVFYKLMNGKINRSGFDPSVIVHEASHYFFHHLFPNPMNDEIGGLNEGFADYIANIFLSNPKVGMVMLHGKALRDSSMDLDSSNVPKVYSAGMEVHDLGERVSYALWRTRELTQDKEEFDRLVIDSVKELGKNPFSTIHDWKQLMLARIPLVTDPSQSYQLKSLWELVFPGTAIRPADISALKINAGDITSAIGLKETTIAPDNMVRDMGLEKKTESQFTILQIYTLAANQEAYLISGLSEGLANAYVVTVDKNRENILGIYDVNKNLITDQKVLTKISSLAQKTKKASALLRDFIEKTVMFSELEKGEGSFALSYRVKDKKVTPETVMMNGSALAGQKVRLKLKRKFLSGVLIGMPDIDSIEMFTAPVNLKLAESNGQKIIGYRIEFETGMITETLLNNFPLN